ncbi:tape measure protein [Vreelandella populi]|uniref:tape measure protein n=1 Tax=Vreelandella populi TaxID=2498858 RepID=UPI001F2206E9|nr:tape measure protein [Halomonas populi]
MRRLNGVVGLLAGAFSVRQVANYADGWSDLNARVNNVTKDLSLTDNVMRGISETARRTYSSLEQTAETFLRNSTVLTELGYSLERQIQLSDALNNSMVISGLRGQEAESVFNALSRAFALGELRGDQLNTVIMNGGRLTEALAAAFGSTTLELQKLSKDGLLTTGNVVEGLIGQLETLEDEADGMDAVISEGFSQIGNAAQEMVGRVDQAVGASLFIAEGLVSISDAMRESIEPLINNLDFVRDAAMGVAAVYGGRLVSALAAGTAAQISSFNATRAHTAALAENQAMEAGRIVTIARRQAAESTASANQARIAAQRASVERQEAAQDVARLQRWQTQLSAERALEVQRMQAQISQTGRLRSQARLAELRTAEIATTNQLTASTARLAEAEIAEASSKRISTAATIEKTRADATATTAMGTYTASATAATRANGLLAASGRLAASALALIGGPLGAAVIAGGALFYFREELGLIPKPVQSATDRIDDMTSALDANSEAALKNAKAMLEAERQFQQFRQATIAMDVTRQRQIVADEQRQWDAVGGQQAFGMGQRSEAQQALHDLQVELMNTRNAIDAAGGSVTEIDEKLAQLEKTTRETVTPTTVLTEETEKLTKAQRDAQREAEQFANSLQALTDRLYPVEAAQRSYAEEQALLTRAWNEGTITADRYTEAMQRLERAQLSTQTASTVYNQGFGAEIGARGGVGSPTDPLASIGSQDQDYWGKWLQSAETALTDFDQLAANTAENFQRGFGNAFESMVFDSENTSDALRGMAEGIARSTVNALGQMAGQWLAYQAVQLAVGKTAQIGAATALTANAQAGVFQAGINAFSSTAAIPIVGPAMAPAAMAAAIGATQPLATAVSSAALAGMAHDGIGSIPREGTWLLDKGERVLSNPQADRLDAYLNRQERGGNKTTNSYQIHVDARGANNPAETRRQARLGAEEAIRQTQRDFERNGPLRRTLNV